jgi:acyl CoA:acetate/3-ketoacid CoA transferase
MIHKHIKSERQLTTHTCSGTILKQDLINALKALYDSEPTPNHLWNFTESDLSQFKGDDLKEIAEFAKQYNPTRIGSRYGTAVVVNNA